MDANIMMALAKAGGLAALGVAAIGSAIGSGLAGASAIGAWKKCYAQSKAAPFILITFIGAPLSQTIYGMILMNHIVGKFATDGALEWATTNWAASLLTGICGGLGMCFSAWFQGKAGAAGADALAETGQGFGNYLMTLGVVETVALFVLVFSMMGLG
ncbi:MAG: V-type ATP synthase subunit K [Kiritimatiellae bacterium]|jgi:V/A-type H+-transporting ATPase subunit K|nr:V-type ATP synthase subunit K [Kiritimatiellia bacterium]MDD4340825.1 V-type ATP synthase subunit K [Kiritimatiellia bacterium]MDY0149056.1 V-type ATP synthase subunit K [Kiritimatiellia bacterium]